jgi:hypothetical protein
MISQYTGSGKQRNREMHSHNTLSGYYIRVVKRRCIGTEKQQNRGMHLHKKISGGVMPTGREWRKIKIRRYIGTQNQQNRGMH